ncbi:DRAP deaminase [Borealophlyctis nickersoniae]|nr:DRAP deaminase [Borealophlyctis nickersoniae]
MHGTKYQSANLNKGFKANPSHQASRGGMQTLGSTRPRMQSSLVAAPRPVDLPSLRRENAGLDPSVALVPPGGGGWGTHLDGANKGRADGGTKAADGPDGGDADAKRAPRTWGTGRISGNPATSSPDFPTAAEAMRSQKAEKVEKGEKSDKKEKEKPGKVESAEKDEDTVGFWRVANSDVSILPVAQVNFCPDQKAAPADASMKEEVKRPAVNGELLKPKSAWGTSSSRRMREHTPEHLQDHAWVDIDDDMDYTKVPVFRSGEDGVEVVEGIAPTPVQVPAVAEPTTRPTPAVSSTPQEAQPQPTPTRAAAYGDVRKLDAPESRPAWGGSSRIRPHHAHESMHERDRPNDQRLNDGPGDWRGSRRSFDSDRERDERNKYYNAHPPQLLQRSHRGGGEDRQYGRPDSGRRPSFDGHGHGRDGYGREEPGYQRFQGQATAARRQGGPYRDERYDRIPSKAQRDIDSLPTWRREAPPSTPQITPDIKVSAILRKDVAEQKPSKSDETPTHPAEKESIQIKKPEPAIPRNGQTSNGTEKSSVPPVVAPAKAAPSKSQSPKPEAPNVPAEKAQRSTSPTPNVDAPAPSQDRPSRQPQSRSHQPSQLSEKEAPQVQPQMEDKTPSVQSSAHTKSPDSTMRDQVPAEPPRKSEISLRPADVDGKSSPPSTASSVTAPASSETANNAESRQFNKVMTNIKQMMNAPSRHPSKPARQQNVEVLTREIKTGDRPIMVSITRRTSDVSAPSTAATAPVSNVTETLPPQNGQVPPEKGASLPEKRAVSDQHENWRDRDPNKLPTNMKVPKGRREEGQQAKDIRPKADNREQRGKPRTNELAGSRRPSVDAQPNGIPVEKESSEQGSKGRNKKKNKKANKRVADTASSDTQAADKVVETKATVGDAAAAPQANSAPSQSTERAPAVVTKAKAGREKTLEIPEPFSIAIPASIDTGKKLNFFALPEQPSPVIQPAEPTVEVEPTANSEPKGAEERVEEEPKAVNPPSSGVSRLDRKSSLNPAAGSAWTIGAFPQERLYASLIAPSSQPVVQHPRPAFSAPPKSNPPGMPSQLNSMLPPPSQPMYMPGMVFAGPIWQGKDVMPIATTIGMGFAPNMQMLPAHQLLPQNNPFSGWVPASMPIEPVTTQLYQQFSMPAAFPPAMAIRPFDPTMQITPQQLQSFGPGTPIQRQLTSQPVVGPPGMNVSRPAHGMSVGVKFTDYQRANPVSASRDLPTGPAPSGRVTSTPPVQRDDSLFAAATIVPAPATSEPGVAQASWSGPDATQPNQPPTPSGGQAPVQQPLHRPPQPHKHQTHGPRSTFTPSHGPGPFRPNSYQAQGQQGRQAGFPQSQRPFQRPPQSQGYVGNFARPQGFHGGPRPPFAPGFQQSRPYMQKFPQHNDQAGRPSASERDWRAAAAEKAAQAMSQSQVSPKPDEQLRRPVEPETPAPAKLEQREAQTTGKPEQPSAPKPQSPSPSPKPPVEQASAQSAPVTTQKPKQSAARPNSRAKQHAETKPEPPQPPKQNDKVVNASGAAGQSQRKMEFEHTVTPSGLKVEYSRSAQGAPQQVQKKASSSDLAPSPTVPISPTSNGSTPSLNKGHGNESTSSLNQTDPESSGKSTKRKKRNKNKKEVHTMVNGTSASPVSDGADGAPNDSGKDSTSSKEGQPTSRTPTATDESYMRLCVEQARLSTPVDTAYCVGAILVKEGKVLSRGYSRELPGNTHAEECCLLKLDDQTKAKGATMYTTMEPCGERLSKKAPCAQLLLDAGIARVVMGIKEPPNFVANCRGAALLRGKGVRVDHVAGFEDECLTPNKHLLSKSAAPVPVNSKSQDQAPFVRSRSGPLKGVAGQLKGSEKEQGEGPPAVAEGVSAEKDATKLAPTDSDRPRPVRPDTAQAKGHQWGRGYSHGRGQRGYWRGGFGRGGGGAPGGMGMGRGGQPASKPQ